MESKTKLKLFLVFFKIGACTIGGGYVMLPILQHELVQKKGWISDQELLDYFAISQATPGIIAVNTATFVGYKIGGMAGAFVATFALIIPSLVIISIIAAGLNHFNDIILVQKALKGIRIAVAIILLFTIYKLFKKNVKSWLHILLAVGSFSAVVFLHITPIYVIVSAILIALISTIIIRPKTQ